MTLKTGISLRALHEGRTNMQSQASFMQTTATRIFLSTCSQLTEREAAILR